MQPNIKEVKKELTSSMMARSMEKAIGVDLMEMQFGMTKIMMIGILEIQQTQALVQQASTWILAPNVLIKEMAIGNLQMVLIGWMQEMMYK